LSTPESYNDFIRSQFMRNLWRWSTGRAERYIEVGQQLLPSVMTNTEWSDEFERLMRNRLLFGAYRHGARIGDPSKARFDRIGSMRRRLEQYTKTGNDELLVDVANLALLEFVEGDHPRKHFASTDDEEHTAER